MGREVEGGFRIGNTCTPVTFVFICVVLVSEKWDKRVRAMTTWATPSYAIRRCNSLL